MPSPLQNAVEFLVRFGFFDVVLPFLLVFTIVFAILEKTKILGTDDGKPKKNINSMVAFTIALFVIAAKQIVVAIQASLPLVFLVLLVLICFMLLVGAFVGGDKEFNFSEWKGWTKFLAVVMFIAVILIFLFAFGYLDSVLNYLSAKWTDTFIVSLIFLAIVVGTIYYIVGGKSEKGGGEKKED